MHVSVTTEWKSKRKNSIIYVFIVLYVFEMEKKKNQQKINIKYYKKNVLS